MLASKYENADTKNMKMLIQKIFNMKKKSLMEQETH